MRTVVPVTVLIMVVLGAAQWIEYRIHGGPLRRFVPILERFAARLTVVIFVAIASIVLSQEQPVSIIDLVHTFTP